jgi:hypothetical protein
VLGFSEGIPGLVMVILTFGDYARFHLHLHAIVADGLFRKDGTGNFPVQDSGHAETQGQAPRFRAFYETDKDGRRE